MDTQLYFWNGYIKRHKIELSIVEMYFNKTNIFESIDLEADAAAEDYFNNYHSNEYTDPSEVAEQAAKQGQELYQSLLTMKSNHLLMTISLLYHTWEQQLIKFTVHEISNRIKLSKKSMDYNLAKKIFLLHEIKFEDLSSWGKLNELKLIVNTIKHGDGSSADQLRKVRPDFFKFESEIENDLDILELKGAVLLDGYSLQVKESDFISYVEATKGFWDEMPERAYAEVDIVINAINNQKKGG